MKFVPVILISLASPLCPLTPPPSTVSENPVMVGRMLSVVFEKLLISEILAAPSSVFTAKWYVVPGESPLTVNVSVCPAGPGMMSQNSVVASSQFSSVIGYL